MAENNTKAMTEERKRPIGISILTVLHIGVGMLMGILAVISLAVPEIRQVLGMLGSLGPLFVIVMVFLSALCIASGIGMRKGRKWG
jgi:ABC-type Na+ efflux pump permease subunit